MDFDRFLLPEAFQVPELEGKLEDLAAFLVVDILPLAENISSGKE